MMNAKANIEAATLHSAMAAAFGAIEAATKSVTGQVGQQKYKYADLGSVIEAVKPPLVAHGLFFTQSTHEAQGGVCVETIVHHASGESMSFGKLFVPANKNDAQGFGSALTYARRYSLMTAFGVPAEDDDGNAAGKSAPKGEATKLVDDGQATVLQGFADGGVINAKRFCDFFQIANLRQLPADRYDEALRMAQAKQAKALEPVQ